MISAKDSVQSTPFQITGITMKHAVTVLIALILAGCSVTQLPQNLSRSMLNQDDPSLVEAGAPAYLLLLDALILTYPDNEGFLLAGAQLYGAYAGVFSSNEGTAKLHADKAMNYARRAICSYDRKACELEQLTPESLLTLLNKKYDEDDLEVFYAFGSAWAGWIQANADDWNAIAQLSKVTTLLKWVERYDPGYDYGTLQVYLGVLETQLPPSVGGKPEVGRGHFEKALELSDGKHLMAKVMYAKQYARLMFEQELHDRLLKETLDADPQKEGLTLINRLAQRQAEELLAGSTDYFE